MFSNGMKDRIPCDADWNFELVEREPEKYFVELEWLRTGNEFMVTGSTYYGKYIMEEDHKGNFPRFVCASKNSELLILEIQGQVQSFEVVLIDI